MRQEKTSSFRKLAIYGFELVKGGHNFFALMEFDVTDLRADLRKRRRSGEGGSFLAFMLKAIGICLGENPLFNSFINLKRTTAFDEVDINIPVEILRDGKWYTKQCILRDINRKSLKDVAGEIDSSKYAETDEKGFIPSKAVTALISILPAFFVRFLFRLLLKNHGLVKKLSGTIFVTSISMYSSVPGFILPYIGGPKAVSFAIGSITKKPLVIKDEIKIREVVSVTAIFNHDLIDGAPAARLINRLRELIEKEYRSIS